MALSGSRLQTNLAADFLSQIQTAFPVNASLLTAEKTALQNAQTSLANALAAAAGPDVVTEAKNATLTIPGTGLVAPSGGGAVTGSSTTGGLT